MATAVLIASAVVSAIGAYSAGQAQKNSALSAQQAANYNATVDKQNAAAAEQAGSARELAMRQQNDQIMGQERASVGESGGGFTGTNVGVLAQNGTNLELNALNSRYNSTMQARGLLSQSTEQEYQGMAAGMNASSDNTASYLGAASSALGATSNYYNAQRMYGGGYG